MYRSVWIAKELVQNILNNPPPDRIYLINGKKSSTKKVMQLKYEMISDVDLQPPEDAIKKYGVTGEKGVVAFLLK